MERKGKGEWMVGSGEQVTHTSQGARSHWVNVSVELHCIPRKPGSQDP